MKPRMCYFVPIDAFIEGRGYRASVVVEGQPGHHPTGVWPNDGTKEMPYFFGRQPDGKGFDYEWACRAADNLNEQMGISKRDSIEIVASSVGAQVRQGKRKGSKLKEPKTEQKRKRGLARYFVKDLDTVTGRVWQVRDRNKGGEVVTDYPTRQQARKHAWNLNKAESMSKEKR